MIFLKRYKCYAIKVTHHSYKLFSATINDLLLSFHIHAFTKNFVHMMVMTNLNIRYHHRGIFNKNVSQYRIYDNFLKMQIDNSDEWYEFARIIIPFDDCDLTHKYISGWKNNQRRHIERPIKEHNKLLRCLIL
mgnify:CR=1 FL=1